VQTRQDNFVKSVLSASTHESHAKTSDYKGCLAMHCMLQWKDGNFVSCDIYGMLSSKDLVLDAEKHFTSMVRAKT